MNPDTTYPTYRNRKSLSTTLGTRSGLPDGCSPWIYLPSIQRRYDLLRLYGTAWEVMAVFLPMAFSVLEILCYVTTAIVVLFARFFLGISISAFREGKE